jgi:hypothetical protein
MLFCDFNGVHF